MRKAFVIALMFTAAACGGTTASTSSATSSPAAPTVAGAATISISTNARLGKILVDGSGKTLYLFAKDTGTTSTCYGSCATYWPPVLTNGAPQAGTGVDAMLLSTTARTDGTTEVTYAGHPLYYVVTDHNPGDATGQAVTNYGAAWYAVGPDGNKVQS